jgi:prepilin-type N-terminal cleavage/methylation domain-containing protein
MENFTPRERLQESGFTLIELAVTLSVFVLLAAGMAASVAANASLNRSTQETDVARESARAQIEEILAWEDFTTIGPVYDGRRIPVGSLVHPDGGLPGSIQIDQTDPALTRVTVRVDWIGERGAEVLVLRTQLADVYPQ